MFGSSRQPSGLPEPAGRFHRDATRGEVKEALASADVRVDATYTTAENTHSPIGLFTTVAAWDGDSLTVHDTTQWPHGVRESLAAAFWDLR